MTQSDIADFLGNLPEDRKALLSAIHQIILRDDNKVQASLGKMMGKVMILYHCGSVFKYGLASNAAHMSLHLMPIYGSAPLHEKYRKLLTQASFQKGCINFNKEQDMPLEIVRQLIQDCAAVDMAAIYQQARLAAASVKKKAPKK